MSIIPLCPEKEGKITVVIYHYREMRCLVYKVFYTISYPGFLYLQHDCGEFLN